jgi:hypothetical protein
VSIALGVPLAVGALLGVIAAFRGEQRGLEDHDHDASD